MTQKFGPAVLAWLFVLMAGCASVMDPVTTTVESTPPLLTFENRPAEDDVIYFLITDRFQNGNPGNDRGDIDGDRLQNGFDPVDEKFYHGGDLSGVRNRLDYLEELGVTAIWITPVFRNLPVQQFGPWLTASYHGYWIADFLNVDPHLGSANDLRELVDAAHERDIKVILDIVVNHTAHVVKYRECHDPDYSGPDKAGPAGACVYRGTDDYPGLAYTPYIDEQDLNIKNPGWLNDTAYYHNRGEIDYNDHSSLYWGDFSGLDDVNTEHPRVVEGMIEIFQYWIREFGIDGYRIDTAGHVNQSFFSEFAPALQEQATAVGRPEFMMFGEVADDMLKMRSYVTDGNLPAVLDFKFQKAVVEYVAKGGTAAQLAAFFADGDYFIDHDTSAYQLPTFLGNHDDGRFGVHLRKADPSATDIVNVKRSILGHAILYFSRGVPILYYGDEQGFIADPGFHESREDMFASVTPMYNANDLIGTDSTTADDNFDRSHPLYQAIQELSTVYREHPTLRRGDQIQRFANDGPGILAFSRIDPKERVEYLVLVNNDLNAASAKVPVATTNSDWTLVSGNASVVTQTDHKLAVTVEPLGFAVYRARNSIPVRPSSISLGFVGVDGGGSLSCPRFIEAVPTEVTTHVEFSIASGDNEWQLLGVDRDPPFRIYLDVAEFAPGSDIALRARTVAYTDEPASSTLKLTIGTHQEHCQ